MAAKIDRLSRSVVDASTLLERVQRSPWSLVTCDLAIDTTTPGGKLVFHVFGALAEFERNLIRERTQAGLTAARARGRTGGRPKSLDARQ